MVRIIKETKNMLVFVMGVIGQFKPCYYIVSPYMRRTFTFECLNVNKALFVVYGVDKAISVVSVARKVVWHKRVFVESGRVHHFQRVLPVIVAQVFAQNSFDRWAVALLERLVTKLN